MKPWVLYTRVSSQKQAERGASLEAQLAACSALAAAHGHQTIHITDEGESAGEVNQPGIAKLRAMASDGRIAGVLVYKLDRIARNTRGLLDLVEFFADNGVALSSVQERIDTSGASGRLILTVLAALAEFERSQLIERVTATNNYRRTQGAWVGGAPPAGLTIERREKLRFLKVHPEHGPLVAQCWPLIIEGMPLAEVARHLQQSGVPTTTGKRKTRGVWARNATSRVLKNRTYVGMLVTEQEFDRAQVLLTGRTTRAASETGVMANGRTERIWRLQGIAKCATCGMGLTGGSGTGRGGVVYFYLRCTGRFQRGREFCSAKDLPAEPWEDHVVKELAAYLRDKVGLVATIKRAISKRMAQLQPLEDRARELMKARDQVKARLDRVLEIAMEGGATARAVAPKLAEVQVELEAADRALGKAQGELAAVAIPVGSLEATAELLGQAGANLTERDWSHQRGVLTALVAEARLGAGAACSLRIRIPHLEAAAAVGSSGGEQLVAQLHRLTNQRPPLVEVGIAMEGPARQGRGWFKRATAIPGPVRLEPLPPP